MWQTDKRSPFSKQYKLLGSEMRKKSDAGILDLDDVSFIQNTNRGKKNISFVKIASKTKSSVLLPISFIADFLFCFKLFRLPNDLFFLQTFLIIF